MMKIYPIRRFSFALLLLATLLFLPACLDFKTRELTGSGMDMILTRMVKEKSRADCR